MSGMFNEDFLVQSPSYAEVMNGTVLPWLQDREKHTTVLGFQNRPLYCVSYEAEDSVATVLIVHGFTENAFKYAELIFSLLHHQFSVVAFDQRGHGRSWRDEKVFPSSVTHVDHFSDYVYDLATVCRTFYPNLPQPLFVFAHSMGGAITSLFLENHHNVFSAAVLSAPMIAPYTGGIPAPVASLIGVSSKLTGKGKKNPFFMKPYSGPEDFATSCATDLGRFSWYDTVKATREEFQNSVPSYQWIRESLRVTDQILAPGAPEKIICPVYLCSAETDFSVLSEPQKTFIERVPYGKYALIHGSKHEIYRSTNDVLFPWWHEVLGFYSEQVLSRSDP